MTVARGEQHSGEEPMTPPEGPRRFGCHESTPPLDLLDPRQGPAAPGLTSSDLDRGTLKTLSDRGYQLIGGHSGAKLCHWTRERLLNGRSCYKGRFYGIESHRCLQMTPTVDHCNEHCLFCWRHHNLQGMATGEADEPEAIIEAAIAAQRRMLSGYRGDERVDEGDWEQARHPRHVAISLAGEPTLYPRLGELIAGYHRRGMTTFLVTNGTNPQALANLDPLPTQLYVTVAAPSKEIFQRLVSPVMPDSWERLHQTLALLPSLSCRTVLRHTLVEGYNLGWELEYARIDAIGAPHFVECKGYVNVGESRNHLTQAHMPSFEKVQNFGERLASHLGYGLVDGEAASRVVLLQRPGTVRMLDLGA